MIESVELASAPCFAGRRASIGPLAPITFIFGPNGSGKTTVSRALNDPSRYPGTTIVPDATGAPIGIRVYNRDYVDATIAGSGRLAGVFLLGEGSKQVQDQIDQLSGPGGTIATEQVELARLRGSLGDERQGTGVLGAIKRARSKLTEAAWAARDTLPETLAPTFNGFRSSKERFLDRLLEVAASHSTTDTNLDSLTREAASVFDDAATTIDELPTVADPRPEKADGFDLLATPIVGSTDVALAALIDELQNSDWVREGRSFLERSNGRCPFCQQEAPHGLGDQLQEYFDSRFSAQVARLSTFIEWYQREADALRTALRAVGQRSVAQLDSPRFEAARTSLEATLADNIRELQKKKASPSTTVKLTGGTDVVAAINAVIDAANALVREHNDRVRNRSAARVALVDSCWTHFVRDTVAAHIATFEALIPGLDAGKTSLETKIEALSELLAADEAKLRELRKKVTSSVRVIDAINTVLASVGFDSFALAASPGVADGYSLIRAGGTPVGESLSEGERTFITFLYFYHQLMGEPVDPTEPRDLVAIIDDPISSLDSDILFVVSTLTRRLVAGIHANTGRVRQLVILTHNVHFHKEVTYVRKRESEARRQYFVIRKRPGQPSELFAYAKNPIKTAYRNLWDEVRAAVDNPPPSPVGLQNIMRRIIESYFTIMGETDDEKIITAFTGPDQVLCRSLFSWVNDGSHAILEEIDYSPTESETFRFLAVFKDVFVKAGHEAHYAMMMGEAP